MKEYSHAAQGHAEEPMQPSLHLTCFHTAIAMSAKQMHTDRQTHNEVFNHLVLRDTEAAPATDKQKDMHNNGASHTLRPERVNVMTSGTPSRTSSG